MTTVTLPRELLERIEPWKEREGNLIAVLHEVQNYYGYIPREVAMEISRILDVPLARIYEVITFYHLFKTAKPGKHTVSVCMGTACYLKGGPLVLEELKEILGIEPGETTEDGMFHLQVVRCLGCCSMAPVIMVDDQVHRVERGKLAEILASYTSK